MSDDRPTAHFKVSAAPKSGVLGRIFGRVPREAAFVEIRNILATTPFKDVKENDISAVLAKSKLRPRDVTTELIRIYEHAAHVLAADHNLSEGDRQGLTALQRAFELTDAEANLAVEQVVGNIFGRAMREAFSDGVFTDQERSRLKELSASLGISEARAQSLYEQAALEAVHASFRAAIADRRYTADEEAQLKALTSSLGVQPIYDDKTASLVARFRFLARVDAGEIPVIPVDIILQEGEVCHFSTPSLLHKEMRTVTKRVNYSGPTASFRVMKGIRWRAGSVSVERVTQDVLTQVDSVDLYITSKRVFLRGKRKNSTIRLAQVTHFTVYNDGLQIEKQSGRDVFLVGTADWELAGACLDSAVAATK